MRGIKLISGCLFLMGTGIALYGLSSVWRAHQSVDWPQSVGTIRISVMESDTRDVSDDRSRPEIRTVYFPNVEYSYSVEGRQHTANSIRALDATTPSSDAVATVLERYPVGAAVPVYYSPDDPEIALLEPGIESGGVALTVFGIVFALFALVFVKMAGFAARLQSAVATMRNPRQEL